MQTVDELRSSQSPLAGIATPAGRHDVLDIVRASTDERSVMVHRELDAFAPAVRAAETVAGLNGAPISGGNSTLRRLSARAPLGVVEPVSLPIQPPPGSRRLTTLLRDRPRASQRVHAFPVLVQVLSVVLQQILASVFRAPLLGNAGLIAQARRILALPDALPPTLVVGFQASAAVVVATVLLGPVDRKIFKRSIECAAHASLHHGASVPDVVKVV